MILLKGYYTADNSDLLVRIDRIAYADPNDKYFKVKLSLINKSNGIEYERCKNYKLYQKNIGHWKRYDFIRQV